MHPRSPTLAVAAALLAGLLAAVPAGAAPADGEQWSVMLEGWNLKSSPVIADIDSDGRNEVVFGHHDGFLRAYEGDGSLKWKAPAVPGVNEDGRCQSQSTPSAIDSSPAVADIDGDGDAEVVVGVGSLDARDQNGSVISFDGTTGEIEWAFDMSLDNASLWDGATPRLDRWCEGTYATPAIGDVDGDGGLDVVFGSWDFRIWAVAGDGTPLPGFPVNNADTVWSSPAVFDVDDDGDVEIFIGGDASPGGYTDQLTGIRVNHIGGVFRAIDYRNGAPVSLWNRFANEVFHSSPAIGDINGDGRFEVVTGTGFAWHLACTDGQHPSCSATDGDDHTKVWAFDLADGTDVPGWPVTASDTIWASPALGDLDGDGVPEVVAGSFDYRGVARTDDRVYAWSGDGSLRWSVAAGHRVTGSATIADLDGDGDQDVAVGTGIGPAMLDGRDGSRLDSPHARRCGFSLPHWTAPAVGKIDGSRYIVYAGWGQAPRRTLIAACPLPSTGAIDEWPMFRHGATRQGTASPSRDGHAALAARRLGFSDAGEAGVHRGNTEALSRLGVLSGTECGPNRFCPRKPLPRWMMAVWLVRVLDDAEPAGVQASTFADVPSGEWWAPHVKRLSELGVTRGCSSDSPLYCPERHVTRAQMAAFLVRAFDLAAAAPAGFVDTAGNTHAADIDALAAEGITVGCGVSPLRYCPTDEITKAEMATLLARATGLAAPSRPANTIGAPTSPIRIVTAIGSSEAVASGEGFPFSIVGETGVVHESTQRIASSQWSPDGNRIAYISGEGSDRDIFVANADGTNPIQLTSDEHADYLGAWSPDSSRIAYLSGDGRDRELFVIDADGTNAKRFTDNRHPEVFGGWSPDGTWLAFDSGWRSDGEIYIANAEGTQTRPLTSSERHGYAAFGEWSRDASRIAFVSGTSTARDVFVVDVNTSDVKRLTNAGYRNVEIGGWLKDGVNIAYWHVGEISVVGADNSSARHLTASEGWIANTRWAVSPVDSRVAFERLSGADREVHVVDADGGAVERLTYNRIEDRFGGWSPDGTRIVLIQNETALVMVDSRGSSRQFVLVDTSELGEISEYSRVSWTPSGIYVDSCEDSDLITCVL